MANSKRPSTAQFRVAEALSQLCEIYIDPFDVEMYPARGYWAHTHQDVQRWTGWVEINGINRSIGSWGLTIGDLNKGRRFVIEDQTGKYRADNNFQFEPLINKPLPKRFRNAKPIASAGAAGEEP